MSDSNISVSVSTHASQVVLHLSEAREYVAFTASEPVVIAAQMLTAAVQADKTQGQTVIDMCIAIIDMVYELRGDLKPAGSAVKHELIERHRVKLTQRLALVMTSQREKKTVSNGQLAKQLTDIMLAEVFS